MRLPVKEIFATVQGEGSATGSPAVFLRLSACNMWSGREDMRDKGTGVCSQWCDTEFYGGKWTEIDEITERIMTASFGWRGPVVVISGGEPCLWLRKPEGELLVERLKCANISVHVETNGSIAADVLKVVDHVTVSPKALKKPIGDDPLAHVVVRSGTDLKVVMPQWRWGEILEMQEWGFKHKFFQPLDTRCEQTNKDHLTRCIHLAKETGWRLSLQTHKLVGWP